MELIALRLLMWELEGFALERLSGLGCPLGGLKKTGSKEEAVGV
jgi:hypothetical protein